MRFDLTAITTPLPGDLACGENPRESPKTRELYYRMKDARNAARSEERSTIPGEAMRLASSWYGVDELGQDILGQHAKDIEVLAWCAEAQLRLNQFAGLDDVFTALEALARDHWDDLHSVGDGSIEDKVAPLAGLNGVGSEGTLIQPLRLTPLVPGKAYAEFGLWDFQLMQRSGAEGRRDAFYEAVDAAGSVAMREHARALAECLAAFDRLVAVLALRCGTEAPSSSNIRAVLLEASGAVRLLAGLGEESAEPIAAAAPDETDRTRDGPKAATAAPPVAVAPGSLNFQSREDAFDALMAVARYFRRTEPHSPIAASLETLVRRGRMEFADLLGELLPDLAVRQQVLTAAGIQPSRAEKGSGSP